MDKKVVSTWAATSQTSMAAVGCMKRKGTRGRAVGILLLLVEEKGPGEREGKPKGAKREGVVFVQVIERRKTEDGQTGNGERGRKKERGGGFGT